MYNLNYKFSKKTISPVVATALLLVVAVTSVVYFQGWFNSFQSDLFSDIETRIDSNSVMVEYLEPSTLYVRNSNTQNLTIKEIKVGGISCGNNYTLGSSGVYSFNLGTCLIGESIGPKEIVLYTDNGVFSQTKMLRAVLVDSSNLTVSFDVGSVCLSGGYIKIYALEDISDSHIEIASENSYAGQSVCLDHSVYTLGTSCFGNFQRLFYLDDVTNAHAYTSNTTSYFNYTTWQEVCISSSAGTITTSVSTTNPNDGSICVGAVEDPIDNINGMHMSSSCSGGNRVWLKIE